MHHWEDKNENQRTFDPVLGSELTWQTTSLSPYWHVPLGNRISPYMVPSLFSSQRQYTAPIALPESWQHLMKISYVPQSHPHKLIRCKNTLWSKLPASEPWISNGWGTVGLFSLFRTVSPNLERHWALEQGASSEGSHMEMPVLVGPSIGVLGVELCQFSKWAFGGRWPPSGSENPL